jgi:hypothetical protein
VPAWTVVEVCSDNGQVFLGSAEAERRQDGTKICPEGAQISPLARTLKGWTHSHALVESQNILKFAAPGFSKRKLKKRPGKGILGKELAAGVIIGFESMRAKPTTIEIRFRRLAESLTISLTPNASIGGGPGMGLLAVARLDGSQFMEEKQSGQSFGHAVFAADRPYQSLCADPNRFSRRLSFQSCERSGFSSMKVALVTSR